MQLEKIRIPLLVAALLITICLGSFLRWSEVFELITFDWRMKLRGQQAISSKVAIIEIGNDSLAQIGRWPFDRKFHAQLIRVLSEYGVRQICFDIIFDQKSTSDNELILATGNANNVYYPYGQDVGLLDRLKENVKGSGHINVTPDVDGKRRYVQPFIKTNKASVPQLGILVAADYLGRQVEDLLLPFDQQGRFIISYAGLWKETFKHYSYVDILVSYEQAKLGIAPRLNLRELKDKVCFIGLTAVGTTDVAPVPLETVYPMVGINANIFNSIITANYLKRVNREINLLILISLLGLAVWLYKYNRLTFRWIFCLTGLAIGFFLIALVLFLWRGLWIDLVYPMAILLVAAFFLLFFSYIKERQKHLLLEHDLKIAARLQQSFLSRNCLLKQAEIEIAAQLQPCRYIGGDFYDIMKLDSGFLAVLIGDVTGKTVPASLYMALSISIFRAYIKLYRQPAKILELVNQELKQRYPAGIFATAILLILDSQGKGYFANAGHTAMHLKNKDKIVSLGDEGGLPLGIAEESEYSDAPINLASKDILVLYTDGVLEAKKKGGEEFGELRLRELINQNDFLPAPVLAERILQGVADFQQPALSEDDQAVVVIKRG